MATTHVCDLNRLGVTYTCECGQGWIADKTGWKAVTADLVAETALALRAKAFTTYKYTPPAPAPKLTLVKGVDIPSAQAKGDAGNAFYGDSNGSLFGFHCLLAGEQQEYGCVWSHPIRHA